MNKYKLVLFDMDGTLADTDELLIKTFNDMYDLYCNGKRKPREEMYYFSGPPIRVTLKKEFPNQDQQLMFDVFHKISFSYYDSLITSYPNEREVLVNLKNHNVKLGVFTNKRHELAEYVLKLLKIDDLFDIVVGYGDISNLKPDPEGMLKAMSFFGVDNPNDVLYVGDNDIDFISAENAKVDCCLVTWGPRKFKQDTNPKYKISNFNELEEFVYE